MWRRTAAWFGPLPEFWRNSGYRLLQKDAAGRLSITDDFLRAYYLRPEIHPVEESCDAELRLHASLMGAPRREIGAAEIESVMDQDARHNYRMLLGFRDRLLAAGTVEGCYMGLFKGVVDVPPLFIEQLAHVILRNLLEGCEDPLRLRAAELFFRVQRVSIEQGAIRLADDATVEMHASSGSLSGANDRCRSGILQIGENRDPRRRGQDFPEELEPLGA